MSLISKLAKGVGGAIKGGIGGLLSGGVTGGLVGAFAGGAKSLSGAKGPKLTLPGNIRRLLPGVGVNLAGGCPSGFHAARDGSGRCVRNRSMNPLNPRALRRALSRAERFEKFARRTVRGLHYGPKKFAPARKKARR